MYAGREPVRAIVTPNRTARIKAGLLNRGLFDFLSKITNGKGRSNIRSAMVEKVEPVGVKFTPFAKSNGKKILKKERRVSNATTPALA